MHLSRRPNKWALRCVTLLFVLGTAQYVERDFFHQDDSILQPLFEVGSVAAGTILSVAILVTYKPAIALRMPYMLLLGNLVLAMASSLRSWDPVFSVVRGSLLILISSSTLILLETYGLEEVTRSLLNSYVALIIMGGIAGLVFPDIYPLMLTDPGEETLRTRLHLFRIHPIALADDCVIGLLLSVLLQGKPVRTIRFILIICLFLTVGRSSIILGLPLYGLAETAYPQQLSAGIRNLAKGIGFIAIVAVCVGLTMVAFDWSTFDDLGNGWNHLVNATRDNSTLSGRTTLWRKLVADLSLDNIYGYGVGGARYYLRSVSSSFSHSHNSALETIYMSGYGGLAFIVIGLAGALVACSTKWQVPHMRVLFLLSCYVIAAGMMNPSWYDTSSLIAMTIACSGPISLRPRLIASTWLSKNAYRAAH